jgi:hypothetical protein
VSISADPVADIHKVGHIHGNGRKPKEGTTRCRCGVSHVVVVCPHCERLHTHGGDASDIGTHRTSHCRQGNGYFLGGRP